MAALVLHRCDAGRNLWRFYRLDVQPDLFGQWCLVREWGRIGTAGQMRSTPFPDYADAKTALERMRRVKERKGYVPHSDCILR